MQQGIAISQQDWSLHRKGPLDQARHQEKIREAIRANLPRIVSEESIITSDGKQVVKVPIRGLELPRFRYDPGSGQGAGQGSGKSKVGDAIGNLPGKGPGKGKGAGDVEGEDYYEVEISVDELTAMLFEDLSLPNLQPKTAESMDVERVVFSEIQRKGVMPNLEKRRTILANLKRNALAGHAHFGGVKDEDLRFRTFREERQRQTNAVVIAMRDISGSMGEFEKYISRSFYKWMVTFLRNKYDNVRIVFLVHHTEAREVDEDAFFKLGESGGTKVSSAYQLATDIIKQRFDPDSWNIYPFHFSDGDNWGDVDNQRCLSLVLDLLKVSSLFGYGEIREGGARSTSTLMNAFQTITDPKFVSLVIADKKDVHPALKKFFHLNEVK